MTDRGGSGLGPRSTPHEDTARCSAETVARLLHVYPQGSTSPALIETGAGERYVLKFAGAGPGVRALLTKFFASHLAARCGLPVPQAQALYLPPRFPWQIGTDEFDDLVQRSAGWNLGVRYIPDARDIGADDLDSLPELFLSQLSAADRLLQNADRTRTNPNVLSDLASGFWAIDHGACLFLERILAGRPFTFKLPGNHFLFGRNERGPERSPIQFRSMGSGEAAQLVGAVPADWLEGVTLSRTELAHRLDAYVNAFATRLPGMA